MASRAQTWPVWLASQESWVRRAGREPPEGRGRGHTFAPSGHRQPCSPPGPRRTSSGAGGRPRDSALGNAVLQSWVPVGQVGAGRAHLCRPHDSHVRSYPPFPEPWHLRGRILQDAGLLKTTSGMTTGSLDSTLLAQPVFRSVCTWRAGGSVSPTGTGHLAGPAWTPCFSPGHPLGRRLLSVQRPAQSHP